MGVRGSLGRARRRVRQRRRVALARVHAALTRAYGSVRLRQPSFRRGRSAILLRRLDGELLVSLGIEHLRAGRLADASAVLTRASELQPHGDRARRFLAQADGDRRVLTGRWTPPALGGCAPVAPVRGRVLHVVGKSLPFENGYTLRTRAIVTSQQAAGLDPHVTTDDAFAEVVDGALRSGSELIDGVPHHRVDPGGRAPGMDGRLDDRIRLGAPVVEVVEPAVLHAASDFLNAEAALAWGRRYDLPVVYEVRGFWAETWLSGRDDPDAARSDVYLGRRARELACMRAADAVVTLGEAMRAEIVDQGVDADRVVVVPNAVDVDRFRPGPRDERLAARLGIRPDEVVVGLATSITAYEGIAHLVEAAARLRRAGRPVRAVVVGDGAERRNLEGLARSAGAGDGVVFTGWVPNDEVPAWYRLLDVFVVPRLPVRVCELVTPLKPFEAMATGRPVVAADLPALREIVDDGATGTLFQPGSTAALTDALDALVTDAAARSRLGGAARRWVTAHRTWAHNAARYVELYQRIGALDRWSATA